MLAARHVHATLPAIALDRARKFYEDVLGFMPESVTQGGVIYRSGPTWFLLYPTQFAGTAQHTLAGWTVSDIEAEVAELKERGVEFEDYDFPTLKTENSIATIGSLRSAWFRDTEGNILGVVQAPFLPGGE